MYEKRCSACVIINFVIYGIAGGIIGDKIENGDTSKTLLCLIGGLLIAFFINVMNFGFTNECKTNKEFWGFGWVNNNSSISNGGADWWSRQGNIIINKDGYLTYLENNVRKNMCQIKKLSHNYLMD